MKKILVTAILVAMMLVGCGAKMVDKTNRMRVLETGSNYAIWQDTRTGVEYLELISDHDVISVTPLIYPSGQPFSEVVR